MNPWATRPGETPIDDVSGLLVRGLKTRQELNIAEADNIREVIVKYLAARPNRELAPFDLAFLVKLHGEMFCRVWNWAGTLRKIDLNLGVPWHQIEIELLKLSEDLRYWESHWHDRLEQAAHLHHRAVCIHPFINGNGRWARMLSNIWLRLHDAPLTIWPDETIGTESRIRQEYLAAIRLADQGRIADLVELHRRLASK